MSARKAAPSEFTDLDRQIVAPAAVNTAPAGSEENPIEMSLERDAYPVGEHIGGAEMAGAQLAQGNTLAGPIAPLAD